ncbi:MAG: squalene/phytoene synthase family protein [Planctomycetota bacterium]|nr:squalene/phytoene synthase family protein [Planctomycetota bacterium]
MFKVPFFLRRPWILLRDAFLDRDQPNLTRLRDIQNPEAFLWAILPHAARTFSACIAMLPARQARAAAVGYLYCRILDTYEDLHPNPEKREQVLRGFGERLRNPPFHTAPPVPKDTNYGNRDLSHLLLVDRCHLVDQVFLTLPEEQKNAIRELVSNMAEGMAWASQRFREQKGALVGEDQLLQYCRHVLGNPVLFSIRLMQGKPASPEQAMDALKVGELVQLANVTRDIEKDLDRGVGYHEDLLPILQGERSGEHSTKTEVIRQTREQILRIALLRGDSYRRMVEGMNLPTWSLARGAAVLMFLFTDRYWRSCARRTGIPHWEGPKGALPILLQTLPAVISARWCDRILRRIERSFASVASTPTRS